MSANRITTREALKQLQTNAAFREALAEHRLDSNRFCSETCREFWGISKGWHACPHSEKAAETMTNFGWRGER